MEWHDASCVRVSSRASLPFGDWLVFIVSNDFVPSLGGLNKWNNELGLFLFSSPSSCLIGVLYSAGATCTSRPREQASVSFSIALQNYCFFLTSIAWHKDNTRQYTPPCPFSRKSVFLGVQTGRNLIKNIKKMLLFRKSDDFFGLCTEKVWLYLKKIVTLWAKIKMIKFACYYMPYNK